MTAAGGLHIAPLGGIWRALVFGFGGMTVAGGGAPLRPAGAGVVGVAGDAAAPRQGLAVPCLSFG